MSRFSKGISKNFLPVTQFLEELTIHVTKKTWYRQKAFSVPPFFVVVKK